MATTVPPGGTTIGGAVGTSILAARADHEHTKVWECEFIDNLNGCPFGGVSISSGTMGWLSGLSRWGETTITTSASSANSGYAFRTHTNLFLLTGNEQFVAIVAVPTTATTTNTVRAGFSDSITATAPVDGCYFEVVDTTLSGKCRSSNQETATGTTYTITPGTTRYTLVGVANSDATLFSFAVYDDAGTQLWSDTVSANIPTGAGRNTGVVVSAFNSQTGSAIAILNIDYMSFTPNHPLTR